MNDKERAAWRALLSYAGESHSVGPVTDAERRLIEAIGAILEDDIPQIDRSARGPVELTTEDGTYIMYAAEWGLFIYKDMAPTVGDCSWEDAERRGWSVRKLIPEDIGYKIRRWGEWEPAEREEYTRFVATSLVRGHFIDKAIDISTRGTNT